jgi:hypothetical protein
MNAQEKNGRLAMEKNRILQIIRGLTRKGAYYPTKDHCKLLTQIEAKCDLELDLIEQTIDQEPSDDVKYSSASSDGEQARFGAPPKKEHYEAPLESVETLTSMLGKLMELGYRHINFSTYKDAAGGNTFSVSAKHKESKSWERHRGYTLQEAITELYNKLNK